MPSQKKLNITLLNSTENAIAVIYAACRQCYSDKFAGELFEVKDPKKQAEFVKRVVSSGHESPLEHVKFTFAIEGVSRTLTHQLVRHRLASYCLVGDTIIKGARNQASRGYKKFTLKSLYERSLRSYGRSRLKLIRLNCYDEKKKVFTKGKIKEILYTGKQEVWNVKLTDGKSIKTTLNHKFFTKAGWLDLKNIIRLRPELGTNGIVCRDGRLALLRDKEWLYQQYQQKNNTQVEIAEKIRCSEHTVRSWIRRHGIQKETGGLHGHPSPRGYTWKLGRLRINNREAEYQDLLNIDHIPYHSRSRGCYRTIKWAKIESIIYHGTEDTYDISMEEPYHNFVANDFVVHNSQQSQRYVKEEDFDYIIPPSIAGDDALKKELEGTMQLIQESYDKILSHLKENGTTGEEANQDARYVLPGAAETKIVVTMNCRELIHFFSQRCCTRAQWEIRALAERMLSICQKGLPEVFASAGAKCASLGYCPEGEKFCCGRYPLKEEVMKVGA